SRKATLPQLENSSMMLASSVTKPSRSGLAFKPTQQFCDASVTITPCSTASSALPPLLNTSHAALLASRPASQVEITTGPALVPVNPPARDFFDSKPTNEVNAETCKNFLRSIIVRFLLVSKLSIQD